MLKLNLGFQMALLPQLNRDKLKKRLSLKYSLALEIEYKAYRNNLNKLLKKAKNDYYKDQVYQNQNNIKKIYEIISEASNENSNKSDAELHFVDDNNLQFSNDKQMADFCNDYFADIGTKMLNNIQPVDFTNNIPNNPNSMFLNPVDNNDIVKHIHSLKNTSSPGVDGITAKILKLVHLHILTPLVHIINLIFKNGQVPHQFKTSIITPIHKAGDKTKIHNYRPISLINNFGKIFEKCLKERLIKFLNNNNILNKNQFGFQQGSRHVMQCMRLQRKLQIVLNLIKNVYEYF